jgi:hypothetical protein
MKNPSRISHETLQIHNIFSFSSPIIFSMEMAGYKTEMDLSQLGPTLLIAASLVLAIRTAKWPHAALEADQPAWEAEVERSVRIAHGILCHLLSKSPFLFPQKYVPWNGHNEPASPKQSRKP